MRRREARAEDLALLQCATLACAHPQAQHTHMKAWRRGVRPTHHGASVLGKAIPSACLQDWQPVRAAAVGGRSRRSRGGLPFAASGQKGWPARDREITRKVLTGAGEAP